MERRDTGAHHFTNAPHNIAAAKKYKPRSISRELKIWFQGKRSQSKTDMSLHGAGDLRSVRGGCWGSQRLYRIEVGSICGVVSWLTVPTVY